MKRDFSTLRAQGALRTAIAIEERNADIYHKLGELSSQFCPETPGVASSFFDLAKTERQHGIVLSTRYLEDYGTVNAGISEEDIRDWIELPRFDVASIMTAVEEGEPRTARRIALEIAADAERGAVDYYQRLVATTLERSGNLFMRSS